MPKENTHLLFAYRVLEEFHETDILREVSSHLHTYLLGSIIPDTFYYSGKKPIERISESFHGKTGNPTNTVILSVLDAARHPKDIAFILGFITHCALDIAFHPVIYYLSGNYYDEVPWKRTQAVYMHRHLETCLDRDLKNTFRIHRTIRSAFLKGLVFEDVVSRDFHADIVEIRRSLRKQLLSNLFFTSRAAYRIAQVFTRFCLLKDSSYLGLFYCDVPSGECLPPLITVADLQTGQERTVTVEGLFADARADAVTMMKAAFDYSRGQISRDELLLAIPGKSLDTGRLRVSAADIRHTRGEEPSGMG
ncbi:MAG: zinc dependent phospholipase C family protein [Deltaproteobacteria bacterium]|nr:zinc dependent phospholipase C family protein [Deltaproteobacteria bacterium]